MKISDVMSKHFKREEKYIHCTSSCETLRKQLVEFLSFKIDKGHTYAKNNASVGASGPFCLKTLTRKVNFVVKAQAP